MLKNKNRGKQVYQTLKNSNINTTKHSKICSFTQFVERSWKSVYRSVARPLQNKHLKWSRYYNSKLFRYFRYKIFDANFFIFENVTPLMPLSPSYQTRASFFWSTKYEQQKIRIYAVGNQVTLRPKEMNHMFFP